MVARGNGWYENECADVLNIEDSSRDRGLGDQEDRSRAKDHKGPSGSLPNKKSRNNNAGETASVKLKVGRIQPEVSCCGLLRVVCLTFYMEDVVSASVRYWYLLVATSYSNRRQANEETQKS